MLDKNVVEDAIFMFQTRWYGKCDTTVPGNEEQDSVVQQTIDDLLFFLDMLPDGAPVDYRDLDDRGVFILDEFVDPELRAPIQRLKKELMDAAVSD